MQTDAGEPLVNPQPTGRHSERIAAPLLARVLRPYRENARYVQAARLSHAADKRQPRPDDPGSWVTVDGDCSIPASCYIDDTGHFNAVELNITYNQLLYLGLAGMAQHGLVGELRHWDLEAFFRHQLPDVLIVEYHAHFPRPLTPRSFRGRFEIREVLPKPHKQMVLLRTACAVQCDHGGRADVEVVIALVRV